MAAASAFLRPSPAKAMPVTAQVPPALLGRARAALARHARQVVDHRVVALVDFSAPSDLSRLHILDLANGRHDAVLVAHGRGSDPAHSGWLRHFSNVPGSQASSAGAYLTADAYFGKHGRSRRLIGLDGSNCNAEARGIVLHCANYVSNELASRAGKIGRSEGCLAVADHDLEFVMARLGPGRLIYVDKI